jgi:hypothetical protein
VIDDRIYGLYLLLMLGQTLQEFILCLGLIVGIIDSFTELIQQSHSILIALIEKILLVDRQVLAPLATIRSHVYPLQHLLAEEIDAVIGLHLAGLLNILESQSRLDKMGVGHDQIESRQVLRTGDLGVSGSRSGVMVELI